MVGKGLGKLAIGPFNRRARVDIGGCPKFAGDVFDRYALDMECITPIVEGLGNHGAVTLTGSFSPLSGRNRGPFCPQPARRSMTISNAMNVEFRI